MRWAILMAALVLAAPVRADAPPIAPAFLAAELRAVGHVTGRRPAPGAAVDVGGCSATLITPVLVLTAAHCAAHRATNPQELFVTFGWSSSGPPLWRTTAARIDVMPGYVRGRYDVASLHTDLALITLPRPVPSTLVEPIPLYAALPATSYASYGYLAGADTLLRGHDGCQVAEIVAERLWGFDCDVVSGFSGGPLLAMTPEGPRLVAVAVAHAPGVREGIRSFAAIPPPELFPGGIYPEH